MSYLYAYIITSP